MARKARTPAPPRRPVQAPKVRTTPKEPMDPADRRRLLILVLISASGLVALAAVAGFLVLGTGGGGGNGSGGGLAGTIEDAGGTLRTYPGLKNNSTHADVPTIEFKPKWNSSPPTSGPHYQQWALWGAYDRAVPLTMSTHNLEHGGIVMHYGPDVPAEEVEKLREFYRQDPNAMLLAPLATAGDKIILSAWFFDDARADEDDYRGEGKQATFTAVDDDAFAAFRDAFRYKGRERVPAENLQPGM